jgi:hypothetical protein
MALRYLQVTPTERTTVEELYRRLTTRNSKDRCGSGSAGRVGQ